MAADAIEVAAARSELIRAALEEARRAHAGQLRSGSGGMAYIHHPVAVAELVTSSGADEETVAAALLHDTVEDSEVTIAELEERFGPTVAALVAALSDDESIDSYRERKREHRGRVVAAGEPALTIYAADKLSNSRVLRRAYASQGESAATDMKVPLDLKIEIWQEDLEMLEREVPNLPFTAALREELAGLREDRAAPPRAES